MPGATEAARPATHGGLGERNATHGNEAEHLGASRHPRHE
jgi:hypothetical protein